MKQGRSITDLAAEIQRQAATKVDMVAPTGAINLFVPEGTKDVRMSFRNGDPVPGGYEIAPLAHRQMGERLGIPAKYYEKMLSSAPDLLVSNVRRWFDDEPEKRLVRVLDGRVRAFLSDRYQRIDNIHVAETALPALMGVPGVEIVSCEVTPHKLYIKAVTHAVRAEVRSKRVGDIVEAGVIISNSEVGLGAVNVNPFFNFLACLNGMIRAKAGMRSAHVGTKLDGDDDLALLLADDTKAILDRGVMLKVRDVIAAAMDEVRFKEAIEVLQGTTAQKLRGDPAEAVVVLANEFVLNDVQRVSVLRHLIEGADLSRYGLIQAVTATAENQEDYDEATRLEALGGRLLDLPAQQWEKIAEAA